MDQGAGISLNLITILLCAMCQCLLFLNLSFETWCPSPRTQLHHRQWLHRQPIRRRKCKTSKWIRHSDVTKIDVRFSGKKKSWHMDGFKMFYFILELDKVFSLPRPLWPQKSWQLRSRVQPKRKIFHQIDFHHNDHHDHPGSGLELWNRILKSLIKVGCPTSDFPILSDFLTGRKPLLLWSF